MMHTTTGDNPLVVSYLILRRAVGILGVALPIILVAGVWLLGSDAVVQNSISDYYDTVMRGVFVGVLFAIGVFLFSYIGYDRVDDVAGDAACVFALGVALFPTTSDHNAVRTVHFVSAAALFLVLSYFSLRLFTKTKDGAAPRGRKRTRNKVYVACGVIMLVCIALIAIYNWFLQDTRIAQTSPVFWLESLALWAFGVSWFIKGDTLLKDAP